MTPTEIATALLAATTLTEDTLAPLHEYRHAKAATGAPVELERVVMRVAYECQRAADDLREHLERAAREATERLAALNEHGVLFGMSTWFVLDGRETAEDLSRRMRASREHFRAVVEAWAAVADRIVATDEDRANAAEKKRAQAVRAWETQTVKRMRDAATFAGLDNRGDKAALVERLVNAGVTP